MYHKTKNTHKIEKHVVIKTRIAPPKIQNPRITKNPRIAENPILQKQAKSNINHLSENSIYVMSYFIYRIFEVCSEYQGGSHDE